MFKFEKVLYVEVHGVKIRRGHIHPTSMSWSHCFFPLDILALFGKVNILGLFFQKSAKLPKATALLLSSPFYTWDPAPKLYRYKNFSMTVLLACFCLLYLIFKIRRWGERMHRCLRAAQVKASGLPLSEVHSSMWVVLQWGLMSHTCCTWGGLKPVISSLNSFFSS